MCTFFFQFYIHMRLLTAMYSDQTKLGNSSRTPTQQHYQLIQLKKFILKVISFCWTLQVWMVGKPWPTSHHHMIQSLHCQCKIHTWTLKTLLWITEMIIFLAQIVHKQNVSISHYHIGACLTISECVVRVCCECFIQKSLTHCLKVLKIFACLPSTAINIDIDLLTHILIWVGFVEDKSCTSLCCLSCFNF